MRVLTWLLKFERLMKALLTEHMLRCGEQLRSILIMWCERLLQRAQPEESVSILRCRTRLWSPNIGVFTSTLRVPVLLEWVMVYLLPPDRITMGTLRSEGLNSCL